MLSKTFENFANLHSKDTLVVIRNKNSKISQHIIFFIEDKQLTDKSFFEINSHSKIENLQQFFLLIYKPCIFLIFTW